MFSRQTEIDTPGCDISIRFQWLWRSNHKQSIKPMPEGIVHVYVQWWNMMLNCAVCVFNQLRFSRIDFLKQFWVHTNWKAKYDNAVIIFRIRPLFHYSVSGYGSTYPHPDKKQARWITLRYSCSPYQYPHSRARKQRQEKWLREKFYPDADGIRISFGKIRRL